MLPREIDALARTVWGEARGESFEGQVAVAWVIKNRANHKSARWGLTIQDVCLRPHQFSCWNKDDPNYAKVLGVGLDNFYFQRAVGIAVLVVTGDLPDPTGGADHYHTIAMPQGAKTWPPKWAGEMTLTARIGRHQFLKE